MGFCDPSKTSQQLRKDEFFISREFPNSSDGFDQNVN